MFLHVSVSHSVHRGGVHGYRGCGCWGRCVVVGAWLPRGGMCGCRGAYVVVGACVVVREGVWVVAGGHAWDMTRYGQWAGSMHPTGMHSCFLISLDWNSLLVNGKSHFLSCLTEHCTVPMVSSHEPRRPLPETLRPIGAFRPSAERLYPGSEKGSKLNPKSPISCSKLYNMSNIVFLLNNTAVEWSFS